MKLQNGGRERNASDCLSGMSIDMGCIDMREVYIDTNHVTRLGLSNWYKYLVTFDIKQCMLRIYVV
jgi:hypothetical protein